MIMPKPARDREKTSDRRAKVLALAVLGWSFSEIGTRLGIAESTAQAIWQREVERFPPLPTREKMRTISGRRLNKARVHAFKSHV